MNPGTTIAMLGDNAPLMLSVLIFLAAGTLAFVVMIGMRAREAVRRRAVRVGLDDDAPAGRRALRYFRREDGAEAHRLRDEELFLGRQR